MSINKSNLQSSLDTLLSGARMVSSKLRVLQLDGPTDQDPNTDAYTGKIQLFDNEMNLELNTKKQDQSLISLSATMEAMLLTP